MEMAERILIVDQDEQVRTIVSQVLCGDGYDVVGVENGEQALEAFRQTDFSLVMTDIPLPGINGIVLLEKLKIEDPMVQVIIMTGQASIDSAIKALQLGAYDYLEKPFESLELISKAVDRAVQNITLGREQERLIATLTRQNKELATLNQLFRSLAVRDSMTGLYNHRYFHEKLAAEVSRAQRYDRKLTVIFIDVDFFKDYNDRHGHQHGDLLLKTLGEVLTGSVRETDTVARWGGEEFVVLAPELGEPESVILAEKLRRTVANHAFEHRETQPLGKVTISLGVASLKKEGTGESLVFRADQALYEAKRSGRNRVCVAK